MQTFKLWKSKLSWNKALNTPQMIYCPVTELPAICKKTQAVCR